MWFTQNLTYLSKNVKQNIIGVSTGFIVFSLFLWWYNRQIAKESFEEFAFGLMKLDFFSFFLLFILLTFGFVVLLLQGEPIWIGILLSFAGLFLLFMVVRSTYPNIIPSQISFLNLINSFLQNTIFSYAFWFAALLILIFGLLITQKFKIPQLEIFFSFLIILGIVCCVKYFFFPFSAFTNLSSRIVLTFSVLAVIFAIVYCIVSAVKTPDWVYYFFFSLLSILFTLFFSYDQKIIVFSTMVASIFLAIIFGLNLQRIQSSTTQLLISIILFFLFIRTVNFVYSLFISRYSLSSDAKKLAVISTTATMSNVSTALAKYVTSSSDLTTQTFISSGIIFIFWILIFVFYFVISKTMRNPNFLEKKSTQPSSSSETSTNKNPKYKSSFVAFISILVIFLFCSIFIPLIHWSEYNENSRPTQVQYIFFICGLMLWLYWIFNQSVFNSLDFGLMFVLMVFCLVFFLTIQGKILLIFNVMVFIGLWILILWLISLMQHKFNKSATGGMSFVVIVLILLTLPLGYIILRSITEDLSSLITNKMINLVVLLVFVSLIAFYMLKLFSSPTTSKLTPGNSSSMTWTDKMCTILFIFMFIYLIVKLFKNSDFVKGSLFMSLFTNIIEYIPCLIDDFFVFIFNFSSKTYNQLKAFQYGQTTMIMQQNIVSGIVVLIIVSMLLILYFRSSFVKSTKALFLHPNVLIYQAPPSLPSLASSNKTLFSQKTFAPPPSFTNIPSAGIPLNKRKMIWTYEDLNVKLSSPNLSLSSQPPSTKPIYNFGCSFWLYLQATGGPDEFIPILEVTGNLKIEVNLHRHALRIVVQNISQDDDQDQDQENSEEETSSQKGKEKENQHLKWNVLFQTERPELFQNWSCWTINSNANVFDVFWNSQLQTSKRFLLNQSFENVFVGHSPSPIQGSINHIMFSPKPFSIYQIYYNYLLNSPATYSFFDFFNQKIR